MCREYQVDHPVVKSGVKLTDYKVSVQAFQNENESKCVLTAQRSKEIIMNNLKKKPSLLATDKKERAK